MTGLILALIIMIGLILSGTWIAISLGLAGIFALAIKVGPGVWDIVGIAAWSSSVNFVLAAIPLFIFMGEFLSMCGITKRVYEGLNKALSGLPGGLEQTNISACAVFAAASGSNSASAATMGRVAYPELHARGYDDPMTLGSIAAGGTLGILIPPSIVLVIYGVVVEESIGQLFMAGITPGLALTFLFMLYIGIRCVLQPNLVPREAAVAGLWDRISGLVKIWPFLLVMIFVLGTIYLGIATPTEAAAIGATSSVLIAMAYRIFTPRLLLDSAIATLRTTCMLLLIFICAKILVMSLGYYDVPDLLSKMFLGIGSPAMVFIVIIALYLVLGCFFDAISMMLITVPILLPVIQALGWSKVWFGVVFTVCVEASCLTPPVGVNLFVLQGVTGAPLEQVIKGSWPYIVIILGFTGIMYLWPGLALWLPNLMYGL